MQGRQNLQGLRAQSAKNPQPRPLTGTPYGNSSKVFKIVKKPPRVNNLVEERPTSGAQEGKPRQIQQETDFFRNNMEVYDKERLFENLLQAKSSINQLIQENYQLKTQGLQNEKTIQKYERIIEDFQNNGNLKNVQMKLGVETSLFLQMKRQIKEQQLDIRDRDALIANLKKNAKVSKFQELDAERSEVYDELFRLRQIIKEYEMEMQSQQDNMSNFMNNNQFQAQVVKKNETLLNDNQELVQIVKLYEERNQQMEQQLNHANRQVNKINRELQQANQRLQMYKKKGPGGQILINQEDIDKEIQEKTKLNYQVEEQNEKIQNLEQQLKKYQLENRKQLEQKQGQGRSSQAQVSDKQSNSEHQQHSNRVDELQEKNNQEQEIAQCIGDEIRFQLMLDKVQYSQFKDILGTLNKGRMNENNFIDFLISNFTISKDRASMMSKYIFQSGGKTVGAQVISSNRIKNQLFGFVEEYYIIANDEYLSEAMKIVNLNKSKLEQKYKALNTKTLNIRQLLQIFQNSQVEMNDIQKDEYFKWIYKEQHNLLNIDFPQIFHFKEIPKQQIIIQIQDQSPQKSNVQEEQEQEDHYEEDFDHHEQEHDQQIDEVEDEELDQAVQKIQKAYKKKQQKKEGQKLLQEKKLELQSAEKERQQKQIEQQKQLEEQQKLQFQQQQQEKEQQKLQIQKQLEEEAKIKQEQDDVALKIQKAYKYKQQKQEGQKILEEKRKEKLIKEEEERKLKEEEERKIKQEQDEVAQKIQKAYKKKQQKEQGKLILEAKKKEIEQEMKIKNEQDQAALKIQKNYKIKQQKQQGKKILNDKRIENEQKQQAKLELEKQQKQEEEELDDVAKKIQKAYKQKKQKAEGKQLLEQKKLEKQQLNKEKQQNAQPNNAFQQKQKTSPRVEDQQNQDDYYQEQFEDEQPKDKNHDNNNINDEKAQEKLGQQHKQNVNEENYEEVFEDLEESKKLEEQQIEDKIFSSVGLLNQSLNKDEISDAEQKF